MAEGLPSSLFVPREIIRRTRLGSYLLGLHERLYLSNDDLSLRKRAELEEIWQKTFLRPQGIEGQKKEHLKEDLLRNLPVGSYISEEVVVGQGMIQKIVPEMNSAIVITDRNVHSLFRESFGSGIFNRSRVYLIDALSGRDLQEIITATAESRESRLIGIGGGRVMDILKYVQMQAGNFTIAVPTSLASHVYASPKIHCLPAIKELGHEKTIDGTVPNLALVDTNFLEGLQENNPRLIRAGLGDLMAYTTAVEDWKLAEKYGRAKTNEVVIDMCRGTLDWLGQVDSRRPLAEWIADYVFHQVLLCHITGWVGSAPASGSEHLFAKEAEEGFACPPLHGELVALGSQLMSYVQGRDSREISEINRLVARLGLPLSLEEIGLSPEQAVAAMQRCRSYGMKKGRFTVVDVKEMNEEYCREVLQHFLEGDYLL